MISKKNTLNFFIDSPYGSYLSGYTPFKVVAVLQHLRANLKIFETFFLNFSTNNLESIKKILIIF